MNKQIEESRAKILKLVMMALLTALVIVCQTMASGIKIGPTAITLSCVPIVIGSIIYGPLEGGFLGFVFSAVVFIAGVSGQDAFTFTLFNASPVVTTLLIFFKGTLAGVVSGLVYRLLEKANRGKNTTVKCLIAALCSHITNTGIFAIIMLTLLRPSLEQFAGGTDILYFLFITCIGLNFLVETGVSVILSTAVSRLVIYFGKRNRNITE